MKTGAMLRAIIPCARAAVQH